MNPLENITFRRNRTKSDTIIINNNDNSILSNSTFDGNATSLPDLSDAESDRYLQLKQELERLKLELCSAHDEIESLTLENNKLKTINDDLQKQNYLYKKVTTTPSKIKLHTPKRKNHISKIDKDIYNCPSRSEEIMTRPIEKKKLKHNQPKNKICIISSNNSNKVLSIAQKQLSSYNICHYINTNCGTSQLLTCLSTKLNDYNMNDYCILLIGEEDFIATRDYFNLIYEIRKVLNEIVHTNIILCLPTFKFNGHSTMFNCRIENFNNLLFLDIMTHQHAYLIDSNLNLRYDDTMFNHKSGKINNLGIFVIFEDLVHLINELSHTSEIGDDYNTDFRLMSRPTVSTEIEEDSQLFLV